MNRPKRILFCFLIACPFADLRADLVVLLQDTIPVIFHVVHTGTPIGAEDNPPDSLILDLLDQMNNAFNLNGPEYGGANIGFTFQLANRSPSCTPTTGINRINGSSVPKYSVGGITLDTAYFQNSAFDTDIKDLSRWPNTDYMNIWIVNTIDDNPFFPGGYGLFPEHNSASNDGIVLRTSVVNGTNKTIIHELGHYFFLEHTFGYAWEVCEPDTNCQLQRDYICDTENCTAQFTCDSPTNPCTDAAWIVVDPIHQYTVLNNYMGYTDCQWMFTEGQKTRMEYALQTFRPGLLSSGAFDTVTLPAPTPACIPTAVNGLSFYYGIERVEIGSLNVYSNSSAADGAFYVDHTCNQNIEVAAGDSVPIRITCSYQNYAQVRAYLDYNNDGLFTPPTETILASDGGIIEDTIVIPLSQIELCVPLRLRIVADHPAAPPPTACMLTGTPAYGVGQIEDYGIIIRPRQVESLHSGPWNNPMTWSCNCIPSLADFVFINTGHIITITPAMGTLTCADMHLASGVELNLTGVLNIVGGCH